MAKREQRTRVAAHKGSRTIAVLDALSAMAGGLVDVFDVFMSVPYGSSIGRMEYELSKRERERFRVRAEKEARRRYHSFMYKLKRDGLITVREGDAGKLSLITKRGREKLAILLGRAKTALPGVDYAKEEGGSVTIVAFDVPEREARKRQWLRGALVSLGFRMIQKSVWIGKIQVPKRFLEDLKGLGMLDYVEIFAVSKTGTLRHIA